MTTKSEILDAWAKHGGYPIAETVHIAYMVYGRNSLTIPATQDSRYRQVLKLLHELEQESKVGSYLTTMNTRVWYRISRSFP